MMRGPGSFLFPQENNFSLPKDSYTVFKRNNEPLKVIKCDLLILFSVQETELKIQQIC